MNYYDPKIHDYVEEAKKEWSMKDKWDDGTHNKQLADAHIWHGRKNDLPTMITPDEIRWPWDRKEDKPTRIFVKNNQLCWEWSRMRPNSEYPSYVCEDGTKYWTSDNTNIKRIPFDSTIYKSLKHDKRFIRVIEQWIKDDKSSSFGKPLIFSSPIQIEILKINPSLISKLRNISKKAMQEFGAYKDLGEIGL